MLKIFLVGLSSLLFGALLATGATDLPVRPGLIGLAALLASAGLARRYWQRPRQGHSPGSIERSLWHGLVSYGLVAGHLAAVLWRIWPAFDLHSLAGHALAIDSWTLVLGAVISYGIARDPEPREDERDAQFAARGLRAGHFSLVAMLLVLLLALGFGEHRMMAGVNPPMLAHVLILLLTLQCLIQQVARLRLYDIEARAERSDA